MVKKNGTWRLLDTGPARGSFNLALDEALYRLAREGASRPTIRFYTWSLPAVSVGYFQSWDREIEASACQQRGIKIYRRITGGRAVLHRDEVTYSVVTGQSRGFFGEGLWPAYRKIGIALAAGLRRLGVKTHFPPPSHRGGRERMSRHPSCFSSCAGHEIVAGGKKVAGSAQRRQGEALIQHGSILLSSHAKELSELLKRKHRRSHGTLLMTGVEDLLGFRPSYPEVVQALSQGFGEVWEMELVSDRPTEKELRLAAELERLKYLSPVWNRGRQAALTGKGRDNII